MALGTFLGSTLGKIVGGIVAGKNNNSTGGSGSGSSKGSVTTATKGEAATAGSGTKGANGNNTSYKNGGTYGKRETAYTWKDGTTTFSNYSRYDDAAKASGKEKVGLSGAVSYLKSGITNNAYTNNKTNGYDYENAMRYEDYVKNLYNGGGSNVGGNGGKNPYKSMMDEVQGRYDEYEDMIRENNNMAVQQGANRLEAEKGSVRQTHEENARQAHINLLQQQHAMPEILSVQGITGGASETAQMGLQNTYQNNVSSINQALANAITDIDNAIVDLKNSGDLKTAEQILANSQQALSAYSELMKEYIDYDYKQGRDSLEDSRYEKEFAFNQQKQNQTLENSQYNKVLDLIGNGFSVEGAADILGISQSQLDAYLKNINDKNALDLLNTKLTADKKQADLQKKVASISKSRSTSSAKAKTPSSKGSTSKDSSNINPAFSEEYVRNGIPIPGSGRLSFEEAMRRYNGGKGDLEIYTNSAQGDLRFRRKR